MAPIKTKTQTPIKYFHMKLTYTDTKVMENIDMKVPPSPNCVTFYTNFLYHINYYKLLFGFYFELFSG